MKRQIGYGIIAVLCILGGFQVLSFSINLAKQIDAKFSSSADYELRRTEYENLSKMAYGNGRLWGGITAQSYESGIDNHPIKEDMSKNEYIEEAETLLSDRSLDFYCWGADDCGDLPTGQDLQEWYKVEFGSKEMPENAFRSGYIDAFVEYFIRGE